MSQIERKLVSVNKKVTELSYIDKATRNVNEELKELSFHNNSQNVVFDIGTTDTSQFVDNLELVSRVNGRSISIGGDGRNNQIFLALWAARNILNSDDNLEVTIYAIEEPESHLHPHQQRKLANYLAEVLNGQVIITTHSPQIACEFSPNSIVRLYDNGPDTVAANNGCGDLIEESFIQFGHRLNIIPAEAFFSRVVLLVEGTSELLFYKALAPAIGVDLDNLNISILNVDGVGFKTYIDLLDTLNIYWVVRTDNDIFKIPNKEEYRFAGIQRGINIYREFIEEDDEFEELLEKKETLISGFSLPIAKENREAAQEFKEILEEYDIFIATIDLENDLFRSNVKNQVREFFPKVTDEVVIKQMQKQKATFMFDFLQKYADSLGNLRRSKIALPLHRCKQIVEEL